MAKAKSFNPFAGEDLSAPVSSKKMYFVPGSFQVEFTELKWISPESNRKKLEGIAITVKILESDNEDLPKGVSCAINFWTKVEGWATYYRRFLKGCLGAEDTDLESEDFLFSTLGDDSELLGQVCPMTAFNQTTKAGKTFVNVEPGLIEV